MEHHEFFISTAFNRLIADPIAHALGYPSAHNVLPPHLVMVIIVTLVLIVLSLFARRRFSVKDPGPTQQFLELWAEGTMGLARDIIGRSAGK